MASVFGTHRSYHNEPEKSELYRKICELIVASHTNETDDITVLIDVLKDFQDSLKSIL